MSGNSARRRMMKFMPSEFRLIEARQPPLKDQYDEWLARVICYAFSVPASAFVSQVNRATSETLRMQATLDYYHTGSIPDSFATLPKDWTVDQIRQFQDYFDALMSGNSARRRMMKFMPSEFRLIEARQPPLKDQYDEWLARVICYAFSAPLACSLWLESAKISS